MNPIRGISWREKSQVVDLLLEYNKSLTIIPLDSGLEAEVVRICLDETSFVLKVWNRSSKPSIECQYKLLKSLYDQGLSVTQPFGWGLDKDDNQVLLTSFDGFPVKKVKQSILIYLVRVLSDIHMFSLDDLGDSILLKYDFIKYFYPRIIEHEDIHILLNHLVERKRPISRCIETSLCI